MRACQRCGNPTSDRSAFYCDRCHERIMERLKEHLAPSDDGLGLAEAKRDNERRLDRLTKAESKRFKEGDW